MVVVSLRHALGPLEGSLALVLQLYGCAPGRLEFCGELGFSLWERGLGWAWRGGLRDVGEEGGVFVDLMQPITLAVDEGGWSWSQWAVDLRVLSHRNAGEAVHAASK